MNTAPVSGELAAPAGEKRKRTPSDPPAPQPQKTQKVGNAHLAINYLARQYQDDLPLISNDDSLPSILHLLGEYSGVLERHESMACNLGARPLGPILIKRFERLFDGPPKILKNHGKEGNLVTWLDVVEFARNKPEQFALGQMSEGVRVCQFHTKQCRVQISEEDFMVISSGMPQKLIPPQPIVEDEEKELGTLEILDKNLTSISHLADQVAARTRQLKHRINGRRQAILERRANEPGNVIRGTSPSVLNGSGAFHTQSPYSNEPNGRPAEYSKTGASSSTKTELLSKFFTQAEKEKRDVDRNGSSNGESRQYSTTGVSSNHLSRLSIGSTPQPTNNSYRDIHPRDGPSYNNGHSSRTSESTPTAFTSHITKFPSTPNPGSTYGDNISVHAFSVPPSSASAGVIKEVKSDNDGPYRAEMVTRMEGLKKGDRVLPPCDRCRRLHMDCIKNLTACAGCTKKHAKCSWRDVRESELWGPEKGKVAIPSAGQELERGEREPSVGLRPDHTSAQLLHALTEQPNGAFAANARAMALEGLAAEQSSHSNGNGVGHESGGGHHEYHSPETSQVPQTNFPSRPASSGAQSSYLPPPTQQQAYHAPFPPYSGKGIRSPEESERSSLHHE